MKLRLIICALLSFSVVGWRVMEAASSEDEKIGAAQFVTELGRRILEEGAEEMSPADFQAMVAKSIEGLAKAIPTIGSCKVKGEGGKEVTRPLSLRLQILSQSDNHQAAAIKDISAALKQMGHLKDPAEKGFLAGTITKSVVAGLKEHSGEIAIALMATAVAKGTYDYCTSPKKTNDSANALQPKTVPQKAWKAISENRVVAGCVVTAVPFLINFARTRQS